MTAVIIAVYRGGTMHGTLDRIRLIQNTAEPHVRIKVIDDAGEIVNMASGFTDFTAKVARASRPAQAVLTITGVTGTTTGFLIPAEQMADLPTTPVYIITAAALDGDGETRAAQTELVIDPSPL